MLTNMDEIFLTREQAEEELGVPVLGLLPQIEREDQRLIKGYIPSYPILEAYRSLRTFLYFATLDRPVRTLLIASSVPAEGKSTVTANLAMAMAMAMENKKVIVVDADLRRPELHTLFKTSPTPGLTDVLVGTHTLAEVSREITEPRVTLVPVGSPPPNPPELLGSPAMSALLKEAAALGDIVLIDSSPLLAVSDALLLANRVDGVLLVIGEETQKRFPRQSMMLLSRARANVVGIAFNHMQVILGVCYYEYSSEYVASETSEGDASEGPEDPPGDAGQGA